MGVTKHGDDIDGCVAMMPEQCRFTGTVNHACHFLLDEQPSARLRNRPS